MNEKPPERPPKKVPLSQRVREYSRRIQRLDSAWQSAWVRWNLCPQTDQQRKLRLWRDCQARWDEYHAAVTEPVPQEDD